MKRLQEKLGIDADGIYGPGTKEAVMDYQQAHGLVVDGTAGPDTLYQRRDFQTLWVPKPSLI